SASWWVSGRFGTSARKEASTLRSMVWLSSRGMFASFLLLVDLCGIGCDSVFVRAFVFTATRAVRVVTVFFGDPAKGLVQVGDRPSWHVGVLAPQVGLEAG